MCKKASGEWVGNSGEHNIRQSIVQIRVVLKHKYMSKKNFEDGKELLRLFKQDQPEQFV